MDREFEEYVFYNYDINNDTINRKYYHSKRVAILSKKIAEELKFNLYDVMLATKIGLLHDIARFYEVKLFKSFAFSNNFDHGKYGVKLLNSHNYYEKYGINKKDLENVYASIYYHNKYKLPRKYQNNKFCTIVRDADKIDILHIIGLSNNINCVNGVSQKVSTIFLSKKSIKTKDVRTDTDRIIYLLALVFDLNYDYSCKIILDRKLIDKIYYRLKDNEKLKYYFDFAKAYLEKRSKNA